MDHLLTVQVDWPLKLSFAHGIVCGMNYLHSLQPPVIHSDLKTQNVLVSDELEAKVRVMSRYLLHNALRPWNLR